MNGSSGITTTDKSLEGTFIFTAKRCDVEGLRMGIMVLENSGNG
jgi:hypothetical protein